MGCPLSGIFHLGIAEGERCHIGLISLTFRLLMSANELALARRVSLGIKSLF